MRDGIKFFIGGNWKMNWSVNMAIEILKLGHISDGQSSVHARNDSTEVVIFPPYPFLGKLKNMLDELGSSFEIGAQNIHFKDNGAHTGEVSGPMIRETGATWAIVGHSERRHQLVGGEKSEQVAEKAIASIRNGLSTVICVGETATERDHDETHSVLESQLEPTVPYILGCKETPEKIVIAYEPVWAIGTGVPATASQVQESHLFIRNWLRSKGVPDDVRIIYGGSVSSSNCVELSRLPDVDGFLVGGASLKHAEFKSILEYGNV